MRVATYTQPTAPTRGSAVALCLLVLTVLLGTGVVPTLAAFVGGPIERTITPLWGVMYGLAFLGLMFSHGINWISWLIRYRLLLVLLMLGTTPVPSNTVNTSKHSATADPRVGAVGCV